jgi:hypothetical protein
MYPPRRMLIYRGKRAVLSQPAEMELALTFLLVSVALTGHACG